MTEYLSILRLIHILAAVFMAAPLYLLIAANERGRLGPPLTYRVERYFENIVKRQPKRCYVYLLTVFLSGIGLLYFVSGLGLLVTDWKIALKTALLVLLLGLITYVHKYIQPQIEKLISTMEPEGGVPPEEIGKKMVPLRIRRKKLGSVCLFIVIVEVILGVSKADAGMSSPAMLAFVILAALFSRRVYSSLVPFGWV